MKTLADYKGAVQSFRLAAKSATITAAKLEWEKAAAFAQERVEQIEQRVFVRGKTKGTQ